MQEDKAIGLRRRAMDYLFQVGTPSIIKILSEIKFDNEFNILNEELYRSLVDFVPPIPNVSTSEMINNLLPYTNELYQYGWITDLNNHRSYIRLIDKIKDSYSAEEIVELCENLKLLISTAEQQQSTPLLTQEGYKFLYNYGMYIKDSINSEYGGCK